MRQFGGLVITKWAWLLTKAGSGESAVESLQCSCALCTMIQSHVLQFGPGGVSGDFGSKGCALVSTCFTETDFPVSIEDQLLDTSQALRIVIGFQDQVSHTLTVELVLQRQASCMSLRDCQAHALNKTNFEQNVSSGTKNEENQRWEVALYHAFFDR